MDKPDKNEVERLTAQSWHVAASMPVKFTGHPFGRLLLLPTDVHVVVVPLEQQQPASYPGAHDETWSCLVIQSESPMTFPLRGQVTLDRAVLRRSIVMRAAI